MATASTGKIPLAAGCRLGKAEWWRIASNQTPAPMASTKAIRSSVAPARATSSLTTTAGFCADFTTFATASIPFWSGCGAANIWFDAVAPFSVSCSITLIGKATKTGPLGASLATLKARCITAAISSARSTSTAHLVTGFAIETRSCPNTGALSRKRLSCCPAVMIIFEFAFSALYIMPMPFPNPGATCKLTAGVFPLAWA